MSDIVKILPYRVDLKDATEKTELHTIFAMGDKRAHRFEIEITCGDALESLTGCTVIGKFVNFKENTSIKIPGTIDGRKAIVTLTDPCYTMRGKFDLLIQIQSGGPETTIFWGEGYMRSSSTDVIIYDDYVVMDLDTLLDHIAKMEEATKAANEAADRAPYIGGNGNWYVWDAAKGAYADSGVPSRGPKGDPGEVTQEELNQLSEQMATKSDLKFSYVAQKLISLGNDTATPLTTNAWQTILEADVSMDKTGVYLFQVHCCLLSSSGSMATVSIIRDGVEFDAKLRNTFPLTSTLGASTSTVTFVTAMPAGNYTFGIRVYTFGEASARTYGFDIVKVG